MTEQWRELKETITEMRDNGGTGTQQDVCKFLANYMETLEKQIQEPCEDCISREEAKQFLYERIDRLNDDELYDIFSRIIDDMYNELPSVTPQRPKGKWKRIAGFKDCNYNKCSVCGVYQLFYYGKPSTNYCPNCGAEMSGGGEDEVSD